jgi:glycosyltransferase involved in cell wall biosynthesis
MNIVFLLRKIDSGGISRVVYDSSCFLLSKGYQVSIFYGKFLGDENSFKELLESNPKIKLIQLKGFSLEPSTLIFFPFSFIKYLFLLVRCKIDIVHLHWMSLSFVCILSKLILKIPYITTTHLINKSAPSFSRFYSNHNISISSEISTWLNHEEKVTIQHIDKIFNSVSEKDFPYFTYKQRQLYKEKLGYANTVVLLCLARFVPIKRHDVIINALRELKNYDFVLYFAGEGELITEIKNLVENSSLGNKVKFVGHVDPREFLSFSDVLLLTSDQEGFPMSIIEAMLSGVVPIRTNAEGVYDQIIDRENGFIVEKSNSDQLASVLRNIFEDSNQL